MTDDEKIAEVLAKLDRRSCESPDDPNFGMPLPPCEKPAFRTDKGWLCAEHAEELDAEFLPDDTP